MPDERLFLAVDLSAPARERLAREIREAVPAGLPGRAVPAANWHLTLRFLGETATERRERLITRIEAAELGPAFELELTGAGAFPRPSRAATLWLGVVGGAERLAELAASVEAAARDAGFTPEARPFRAHLTLSRLREPADMRGVVEALGRVRVTSRVREIVLFRSILGGGPPRYQADARFPLGSGH